MDSKSKKSALRSNKLMMLILGPIAGAANGVSLLTDGASRIDGYYL